MTNQTVLIGLDGATFAILDPLMDRGVMPFLRAFVASGVRAPLRSVIPPLTPPAWTSLMTGKHPGRHGVFDFFQKAAPESVYLRLALASDIGSETIWSLASASGRRVTALNFPLMFPPPAIAGSVVPGGWRPWRQLRLGCHPPGLFDRLKVLPSFNARELALDMASEEKALEGCAAAEYADWIELHLRRERRWSDLLEFLMIEEPADLTAILFDGVDKLQHLCWRFLDPACRPLEPTAWEQHATLLCEAYFRQLDGLIARIVSRAEPDATVVLASDHGFGASSDVFHVNTWLEQEGYLAWSESAPAAGGNDRVGIGQIARHVIELDWGRTTAFASTPSSQGIHIVQKGPDGQPGVPPEAYPRVRGELIAALRRLRHPESGRPVISSIWTREEAFAGPYEDFGPDLSFLLEDNGVVSILRSDAVFTRRPVPVGTHHPEGVLLARGPGLRTGEVLPELSIVDVAPLLLHCLGVPVPDDLDGRLPRAAFDPAELDRRPPQTTPKPTSLMPPLAEAPEFNITYDPDEEAVILNRLKTLGYVE